jgi:hypothetical protein
VTGYTGVGVAGPMRFNPLAGLAEDATAPPSPPAPVPAAAVVVNVGDERRAVLRAPRCRLLSAVRPTRPPGRGVAADPRVAPVPMFFPASPGDVVQGSHDRDLKHAGAGAAACTPIMVTASPVSVALTLTPFGRRRGK